MGGVWEKQRALLQWRCTKYHFVWGKRVEVWQGSQPSWHYTLEKWLAYNAQNKYFLRFSTIFNGFSTILSEFSTILSGFSPQKAPQNSDLCAHPSPKQQNYVRMYTFEDEICHSKWLFFKGKPWKNNNFEYFGLPEGCPMVLQSPGICLSGEIG